MPIELMNRPKRSCRPDPGAAIPYGLQKSTGRLLLPSRSMPYGTACMLDCPHCDGTIVHVSRGRRHKDGTYGNNYFKHLVAPDNPTLPCYRKNYAAVYRNTPGGGGPETLVHMLGSEFVGWWYDDREGWAWEYERSGTAYSGSDYRFDTLLSRGDSFMAVEVEVTHRVEPAKVKFLKTLPWAVLVVDLSHPDVREWLYPKLKEWDRITAETDEDERPLAQEIYEFMEEHDAFQPMENDYYVNNRT